MTFARKNGKPVFASPPEGCTGFSFLGHILHEIGGKTPSMLVARCAIA